MTPTRQQNTNARRKACANTKIRFCPEFISPFAGKMMAGTFLRA
jgi:hypothetical protein